jgi:hypothetical protein
VAAVLAERRTKLTACKHARLAELEAALLDAVGRLN